MARPTSSTLSSAQRRVLDAVLKRESMQLPNFVSDLVAELSLRAESSLGPTLQRMARLGVVLLQGGGARGRQRLVVATPKGRLLCGLSGENSDGAISHTSTTGAPASLRLLPLLGTIPAGPLTEVIARGETPFEAVSVEDLLRHRPGDFLLQITGDSMVGDGIFEGDLVLLRPGVEVQQGEIAAVLWSGSGSECEATLKRVFRKPPAPHQSTSTAKDEETTEGKIVLRASNPAYPDLVLPAESVRIAGVFRGLVRSGSKSSNTKIPSGGAQ